jgi:hypothetical protein
LQASAVPVTGEAVKALTGLAERMFELVGSDPRVEVHLSPVRDDATPCGYAWSTVEGPPFRIDGGTRVRMGVVVGRTYPIKYSSCRARKMIRELRTLGYRVERLVESTSPASNGFSTLAP